MRTPRFVLAAALLAATTPASVALAQPAADTAALRPGLYVRVRPLDRLAPWRSGTLVAVDSTTLVLRRAPAWTRRLVAIPADSIRRVDVRLRPSRKLRGAAEGALFGTVVVASALWLGGVDSRAELPWALGSLGWVSPVAIGGGALLGRTMAPGARWARVRRTDYGVRSRE